jgi:hypothetical protein
MLVTALLGGAAPALADSSASSNWAGYAIHRSHVKFHMVFAAWTQPSVRCTPGSPTYSAFWVGLGGYSIRSRALEQIGTEADCSASGRATMSAWYEIVPAPSRTLKLKIRAGDRLAASVTVSGHRVTLGLFDVDTRKSVTKTVHVSRVDVSSAEWIAEAPSECVNANACRTLQLADFGTTAFQLAGAQADGAPVSAMGSRSWTVTKITLEPNGRRFVGFHNGGTADGSARPSAVSGHGTAFTITYAAVNAAAARFASADIRAGQLFH